LLCLLAVLIALWSSVSIADELPDVPSVLRSLEGRVKETEKSQDFQELRKVYRDRVKEAERLINGRSEDRELQEKFNAIRDTYFSKEFQQRIESAKEQIFNWRSDIRKYADVSPTFQKGLENKEKTYVLFVFVSRSMGDHLDLYLSDMDILLRKQGNKPRVIPFAVLRGAIEDSNGNPSLKATVLWLRKKLEKHLVQVWIDPLLFRRFGVDRVPCLVLTDYQSVADDVCRRSYIGCGYSVFGFLRAVEEKTDDPTLKDLLKELD